MKIGPQNLPNRSSEGKRVGEKAEKNIPEPVGKIPDTLAHAGSEAREQPRKASTSQECPQIVTQIPDWRISENLEKEKYKKPNSTRVCRHRTQTSRNQGDREKLEESCRKIKAATYRGKKLGADFSP